MASLFYELASYIPRSIRYLLLCMFILTTGFIFREQIFTALSFSKEHIAASDPNVIDRARALKEYIRYTYRSFKYDGEKSKSPPLMRHRALIAGMDSEGNIHLDIYTTKGKVRAWGRIADIEFVDPAAVLTYIKFEVSEHSIAIDTYTHEQQKYFVLWLQDGTPLNEVLILNDLATPSTTPPTNIVNSLFLTHYKKILFN
jgi:hypothetical protein